MIACPVKCKMKNHVDLLTSTVAPLKFHPTLNFVLGVPFGNDATSIPIIAWNRTDAKPLPIRMMNDITYTYYISPGLAICYRQSLVHSYTHFLQRYQCWFAQTGYAFEIISKRPHIYVFYPYAKVCSNMRLLVEIIIYACAISNVSLPT